MPMEAKYVCLLADFYFSNRANIKINKKTKKVYQFDKIEIRAEKQLIQGTYIFANFWDFYSNI